MRKKKQHKNYCISSCFFFFVLFFSNC